MSAVVYRHYGARGVLLYVGMSLQVLMRTRQHSIRSLWFDEIVRIDITRYDTRAEALAAEKDAIATEKPRHNIMHGDQLVEITLDQALARAGSQPMLAEIMGVRARTIEGWKEGIPALRLYQLREKRPEWFRKPKA